MAPQRNPSWEANARVAAACKVIDQWTEATQLLFQLTTEARVVPDSYGASACLRRQGAWAIGVQQIRWLKKFPTACDEFTGTAALNGCHQGWSHGLRILRLIQEWRSSLDTVSISAAINACAKSAQWTLAMKFCQEMQAPNAFSFSATVNAFEKESGWRKALETVCQMRRWTSGTWVTEAALLNVCGGGLQWSWVMSLFHELRAAEGLDEVLFGTTIDANVRSWQMATELLGKMAGSRCRQSQVCFGATVKACESSMQWLWALQMLRQQEHLRMRPSTTALSACIGACRGDWALGIFIARKLQKLNAISATSTLCSMDGAPGIWPQALRVYEQTEEGDVVTLAATLGICAQGSQPHGAHGAWCCAWHLLELAQRQREDLVALSPACTSLTSSASRAKQWRLALESLALGDGSNLISLATAATALTPQQGLAPLLPRLSSCAMDIMDRLAGHLQELAESVIKLCDRHVHHRRQNPPTPRGRFAELRPSFKPAESSLSLQERRQVVETDDALGSTNFMQNPEAAEALDLRRFSDAASEASEADAEADAEASAGAGAAARPRGSSEASEASDVSQDRSAILESMANSDYVGQDLEGLEAEQELKVPTRARRALNAQRNVLLNLFNKLDTDKSGVLEVDELKSALRAVGQHPQRAEKIIAAADENCNGKVEIHEWIHVVDRLVAGKGGAVMENFTKALVKANYGSDNHLRDARSYTWTWDDKPWYWMISGHGTFRLCWDILLFCLLVYVAVVMPYTLAYLPESDFQNGMNVFMTSCFCFDILLNFRTTFLDEAGEEVRSPYLVGKQYLRSWFLLDFVTAVPFEQVTESMGGLKLLRTSKIFKVLRVVRAIKLWKILRASELGSILEDFVMHSNSGRRAFELFRILVACCLLCHLLACFMHISGSGFLETYEWTGDSAASQYICSLYWAMTTVTTVGYGDIIPRSDGERIFTMAAMIIGGAFYGYVVGNISVILASNDVNWRAHKERLDLIESWISHHRFPAQLRRKIWAFYKKAVSGQVIWDDGVVFAELTVELREEVASYLIHPELQKNLVFQGVPQSVMIRIVGILQQINVKKGETVVPFGSFSFGMFILLDGAAILEKDMEPFEVNDFSRDILMGAHHVTSAEGGKKLTELLRRSDSFGEEVLLGLRAQYEYSVIPQRRTVMLLLPRDQFMERLSGMPEVFTIMRTNFTT